MEAVNSLLLLSVEGFLRFFPGWPPGEPAAFQRLRATGAFVVNGSVDAAGVVGGVAVLSEVGERCTFLSPWPACRGGAGGSAPAVTTATAAAAPVAVRDEGGGRFSFATSAGSTYALACPG